MSRQRARACRNPPRSPTRTPPTHTCATNPGQPPPPPVKVNGIDLRSGCPPSLPHLHAHSVRRVCIVVAFELPADHLLHLAHIKARRHLRRLLRALVHEADLRARRSRQGREVLQRKAARGMASGGVHATNEAELPRAAGPLGQTTRGQPPPNAPTIKRLCNGTNTTRQATPAGSPWPA
jgi:hypothetical protein